MARIYNLSFAAKKKFMSITVYTEDEAQKVNDAESLAKSHQLIKAAGGVVKDDSGRVLMIFRRGKWDLPKGKQDPGETIEECAVREVCEEIGVASVDVLQNLGTTLHTYPQKDRFYIKHTYWYLMTTPAKKFAPEKREGIEKVKWVRWSKAKKRIGYQTLQDHMEQVEDTVFKAVKKLG